MVADNQIPKKQMNITHQELHDLNGWQIRNPRCPSAMESAMLENWGRINRRHESGECRVCGEKLPPETDCGVDPESGYSEMAKLVTVTICEKCVGLADEHYGAHSSETLQNESHTPKWDKKCPSLYKDIIFGDIQPYGMHEKGAERVAGWTFGKQGMICIGPSGSGKTTALWRLYRNLEIAGVNCDYWSAIELGKELSRHARDMLDAHHLTSKSVLMIDDLGKEKITNSAASLWWRLIDIRYERQLPLIITSRYTGEAFEERMGGSSQSDKLGEPIIAKDIRRRLRDMCSVISFKDTNDNPA